MTSDGLDGPLSYSRCLCFIEGDAAKDGIRYYCDVRVLSPIYDSLAAMMTIERWTAAVSPLLTSFSFTQNGMQVDFVVVAIPLLLYLGFYPGVRGENHYGADPDEKRPAVDTGI